MPNTRNILIVDDDPELREALTEQLSLHEEFEAVAAENGSKGVQAAKAGQVDLVIMDVGLPDFDGREAVRILRKHGFKAPIIMLTGHDTDFDTILGFESGANDYVAKPFRFAVLLARIRAQLRQHEASEDAVFTIGPHTFRPSSKRSDTAPEGCRNAGRLHPQILDVHIRERINQVNRALGGVRVETVVEQRRRPSRDDGRAREAMA